MITSTGKMANTYLFCAICLEVFVVKHRLAKQLVQPVGNFVDNFVEISHIYQKNWRSIE